MKELDPSGAQSASIAQTCPTYGQFVESAVFTREVLPTHEVKTDQVSPTPVALTEDSAIAKTKLVSLSRLRKMLDEVEASAKGLALHGRDRSLVAIRVDDLLALDVVLVRLQSPQHAVIALEEEAREERRVAAECVQALKPLVERMRVQVPLAEDVIEALAATPSPRVAARRLYAIATSPCEVADADDLIVSRQPIALATTFDSCVTHKVTGTVLRVEEDGQGRKVKLRLEGPLTQTLRFVCGSASEISLVVPEREEFVAAGLALAACVPVHAEITVSISIVRDGTKGSGALVSVSNIAEIRKGVKKAIGEQLSLDFGPT